MLILGIETSCDETAAALVEDGTKLISSSLATSKELHMKTGGVVPEVAARKQVESIVPVVEDTIEKAVVALGVSSTAEVIEMIDSLAVTVGPGLIGSLVVGVNAAKSLALAWEKPLIPVNHLVGHIYGNFVDNPKLTEIEFPALVLIVSGGHTDLVLMKDHGYLEYLGGTLDDAAGEAFDKVARLLGIAQYLGGPKLSKVAAECTKNEVAGVLPRPKMHDPDHDFSFSGLKTAVRRLVEKNQFPSDSIACEFENAVVDVLVSKTLRAAKEQDVKCILLGGGVSANVPLRTRLEFEAKGLGLPVFVPPISLCTDNAIYIASVAFFAGRAAELENIKADPSLGIMDSVS